MNRLVSIILLFPFLVVTQRETDFLGQEPNKSIHELFITDNHKSGVDTLKSECYTSISSLINCLLAEYPVLYSSIHIDTGETELAIKRIVVSGSIDHLAIQRSYWEAEQSEYQFYNIDVIEFIKLMSRITLGGVGYEYQLMKNSSNLSEIKYYQWENPYDDWVRTVTLEKCQPKGTRITIEGGL